jgi:hypothetical protein
VKNLSSMALGAILALSGTWLLSAMEPAPSGLQAGGLVAGSKVFGFNLLKGEGSGIKGLTDASPVAVRERSGRWALIEFPSLTTGPVWVNTDLVISYRSNP